MTATINIQVRNDEIDEYDDINKETIENEYEFVYGLSVFTDSAGKLPDYIRNNGLYMMTYGGGPEGGYVLTLENELFEVNRNNFQSFTMIKLENKKLIHLRGPMLENIRIVSNDFVADGNLEFDVNYVILWESNFEKRDAIIELYNQ